MYEGVARSREQSEWKFILRYRESYISARALLKCKSWMVVVALMVSMSWWWSGWNCWDGWVWTIVERTIGMKLSWGDVKIAPCCLLGSSSNAIEVDNVSKVGVGVAIVYFANIWLWARLVRGEGSVIMFGFHFFVWGTTFECRAQQQRSERLPQ